MVLGKDGEGGWPIIPSGLWLTWVRVPLGSWSLQREGQKGPTGNWSRLALETRWRTLLVPMLRQTTVRIGSYADRKKSGWELARSTGRFVG